MDNMKIKHETLGEKLLVLAQKAQEYEDKRTELAKLLTELWDLQDQVAHLRPELEELDELAQAIQMDLDYLGLTGPEYIINAISELQKQAEE